MKTHYKNPCINPLIPAHAGIPTYPLHARAGGYRFIDTAPLVSRYDVLAEAVLAFVVAGRLGAAMRTSRKIIRLIRTLTKLEAHNVQLRRKLDMLSHKPWRDCVLRELGGIRKLRLWEAAYGRILARRAAPAKPAKPQDPAWLYTPERIAESERLKAHVRTCFRAAHNPLIVRDRCKVDFDGWFRLAPLPRGERAAQQIKVYTQESIVDYDWNPMPFIEETGFGPACVWPAEFYAAMEIEAEILESRPSHTQSPRPSVCLQTQGSGPISETGPQTTEPEMDSVLQRGEWKKEKGSEIFTISLKDVLLPKVWNDIFTPLPQEASLARS